jgi:hypothetical protein
MSVRMIHEWQHLGASWYLGDDAVVYTRSGSSTKVEAVPLPLGMKALGATGAELFRFLTQVAPDGARPPEQEVDG